MRKRFTVLPCRGAEGGCGAELSLGIFVLGIAIGSVAVGFGHRLDCAPLRCRSISPWAGRVRSSEPYSRNLVAPTNVWIPLREDKLKELGSDKVDYQTQKKILEGFFNEVLSKLSKYF